MSEDKVIPYVDFESYVSDSASTFVVPLEPPFSGALGLLYCGCKLAGETAELNEAIRSRKVPEIRAEAGDVLWYIGQIARLMSLSLILPIPGADKLGHDHEAPSLSDLAGKVAEGLGKIVRDYAPGTESQAVLIDTININLNSMLSTLGRTLSLWGGGTPRRELLKAMTENRQKLLKRQKEGKLHANKR